MKVKIKTQDFRLRLYLPNVICLNSIGIKILLCYIQNYIEVSDIQKKELIRCMKICRRKCKGVTLIEVHSVEGDEIMVSL